MKNNSVTGDVTDRSLLAKDFKAGQLPAGPKGEKGDQGPSGLRPNQTLEITNHSGELSFCGAAVDYALP